MIRFFQCVDQTTESQPLSLFRHPFIFLLESIGFYAP